MRDKIRNAIENMDSLVKEKNGLTYHAIVPEAYVELTDEIMKIISVPSASLITCLEKTKENYQIVSKQIRKELAVCDAITIAVMHKSADIYDRFIQDIDKCLDME